jgi:hypothetical protein
MLCTFYRRNEAQFAEFGDSLPRFAWRFNRYLYRIAQFRKQFLQPRLGGEIRASYAWIRINDEIKLSGKVIHDCQLFGQQQ